MNSAIAAQRRDAQTGHQDPRRREPIPSTDASSLGETLAKAASRRAMRCEMRSLDL
jgi:hypothetical protein